MSYPKFEFNDITSSITSWDDAIAALEENKLTVVIQPQSASEHPFSALIGVCLVFDVSNGEGPITKKEVHEKAEQVIDPWLESFQRARKLSGYDLPLPEPPSRILFKTCADGKNAPGRVFDKDVVSLFVDVLKLELVGTDNNRLADGAEQHEILKLFEQSNITTLLNLNLKEIANGVEGMLIVTPLKIADKKPVLARTVLMQR